MKLTADEIDVFYDVATTISLIDFGECTEQLNSRTLPHIAYEIAQKFQAQYGQSDWAELDYMETVDSFAASEFKKLF